MLFACGDPEVVTVKVMTMNLRHDVDFWEERFPMIADEIVRLQPDFIGLQEVELAQDQTQVLLDAIAARDPALRYHAHEESKTGLAAISGEGIASFSRHPVLGASMVDLQFGRPAQLDRVQIGTMTVDFYNTHLHHEGGDEVRAPQMRTLLKFMSDNDRGNIVFLTGDLNAAADSETIDLVYQAEFIDSFPEIYGDRDPGNTVPIRLEKSFAPQKTTARIDYVLARQASDFMESVRVTSSTVAFNFRNSEGLYPSDHLGVMSTFELVNP